MRNISETFEIEIAITEVFEITKKGILEVINIVRNRNH